MSDWRTGSDGRLEFDWVAAMGGNPSANTELADRVREYCGAYELVRRLSDKRLFRTRLFPISGFERVEGVHDADGLLLAEYWSLPRLGIDGER